MAERPSELNEKITAFDDDNFKDAALTRTSNEIDTTDEDSEIETKAGTVSDDPDEIRASIEETRSEMTDTINAIEEKLSISNISEQVKAEVSEYVGETIQTAKNTIYDATIARAGDIMKYVNKEINEFGESDTAKTLSSNPVALGLIGLGLGILFLGGSKKKHTKHRRHQEDYDIDKRDYNRSFSSRSGKSSFSSAQSKVGDAAGKVSDTVSGAAGAVSETFSNAAGAVSETFGDVTKKAYKQVGKAGATAQNFAGSAQDQYEQYMEKSPLAVGAVALALGAAVGLAFPSTKIENEYMGEARNNLLQKAEATARDAVGKVQQVAGQVTETVKEEAKNQGLT